MKVLLLSFLLVLSTGAYADNHLINSKVKWEAYKVIGGGHNGEIPITKSDLIIEDGKIKKGTLEFDISKATVTDLSGEWETKFLTHIKSSDFFDVEKHPKAKLKITSVSNKELKGVLTIKDKSKNIKVPFNKVNGKYSGEVEFDRTEFGIIYGSNNFFKNLGDKAIANNVKVIFELEVE